GTGPTRPPEAAAAWSGGRSPGRGTISGEPRTVPQTPRARRPSPDGWIGFWAAVALAEGATSALIFSLVRRNRSWVEGETRAEKKWRSDSRRLFTRRRPHPRRAPSCTHDALEPCKRSIKSGPWLLQGHASGGTLLESLERFLDECCSQFGS